MFAVKTVYLDILLDVSQSAWEQTVVSSIVYTNNFKMAKKGITLNYHYETWIELTPCTN